MALMWDRQGKTQANSALQSQLPPFSPSGPKAASRALAPKSKFLAVSHYPKKSREHRAISHLIDQKGRSIGSY